MVRSSHASGAGSRGPSQRQLRVGELVRHVLSELLARGDVHDPVLETTIVTVTEVRTSPDLRHARVAIEPLGGQNEKEVLAALNRNRKYLRGELGKRMTSKYTPDLAFEIDESFAEGSRIDAILRSPTVARDTGVETAGTQDPADED
ncbi:30S ribosome-binding factor RbfA [Pyruvatibacter mobilis]|jgi:ribosome-binding factor A|uniref:30S ribosome-binding factor RbfA n=1 Tax=Pyruvatibacter mobilis TaxID=1712261 RepID=UPI00041D12EA